MGEHSLISPSGAHRWMNCPGSVTMEKDLPDSGSAYAAEGTTAHALLEQAIIAWKMPSEVDPATLGDNVDRSYINAEMNDCIDLVYEYIRDQRDRTKAETLYSEQRYPLGGYLGGGWGTADVTMIAGTTLHIMDLKYGKGVPVDPKENPQLMLYALGAYGMFNDLMGFENVVLHIMQPRINGGVFASWKLTVKKLLQFGEKVKKAVTATQSASPKFKAGDWCRFCKAKAFCMARASTCTSLAPVSAKEANTIPADQIAAYLKTGEDVAAWVKDLKEYALGLCLSGETVKGLKAVEGLSRRRWSDQEAAFKKLQENGIEEALLYDRTPKTLAQLEKELGARNFNAIAAEFVIKPQGAPTLVSESDKRPAITNIPSAAEMFGE